MRVVDREEMRELDRQAIELYKIPSIVLMENAGARAAEIIGKKYDSLGWTSHILIFAGKGNNGGDALVLARHLISMGKKLRLFLLHDVKEYEGEAKDNLEILLKENIVPVVLEGVEALGEYLNSSKGPFLSVDGLLGTGFHGTLSGLYADVVECLNKNTDYRVALDIPTGVDGTTGAVVGVALEADLTIAFAFPKLGHYIYPGAFYRGELKVVDITLPSHFRKEAKVRSISESSVAPLLKKRDRYGHKNSFGHCLLVGGELGFLGAVVMASRSCLRVGTGLVSVAVWEESWDNFMVKVDDEIMSLPIVMNDNAKKERREKFENYSSLVLGPGLGVHDRAREFLEEIILYYEGALVIDADAIRLLANKDLQEKLTARNAPTVLTPHVGEMATMWGASPKEVLESPLRFVKEVGEQMNATVLLKGGTTFIRSGGVTYLNHYPNDGMATAGSGDVLAGIIGGLLGQGMDAGEAVRLAVYLHSLSGGLASQKLGHRAMTASHIISYLGDSFLRLRRYQEKSP